MYKLNTPKDYYVVETEKDIAQVFHYLSTGVVFTDKFGTNVDSNYPPIAFDVETDGLNTRKCNLIGVSVSTQANEGFYFPFSHFTPELKETFKIHLRSFEQDTNIRLVMHNAVYDIMVIRNTLGIDLLPRLKADTMLIKHLLHEERPHSLKKCAERYLGIPATEQQDLKASVIANGGKFNKTQMDIYLADKDILAKYAINDADITIQLYNKLIPMLQKQHLDDFYHIEVHPLITVIINHLLTYGCRCDIEYFKTLKQQLQTQADDLTQQAHFLLKSDYSKHYHSLEQEVLEESYPLKKTGQFIKELFRSAGLDDSISKKDLAKAYEQHPEYPVLQWKLGLMSDAEFILNCSDLIYDTRKSLYLQKHKSKYIINLASTKQLKRLLFNKLGESPIKTTKKDNAQVDNEVLEKFAERYTWISKLMELRKIEKLISVYVDAVLELNEDGIVTPEWLQHGTTSGRFSVKNPNFQTLPREDTSIKRGVIAREGYTLINLDYESLEPHIFAHLSNEPALIAAFNNREDFYGRIATDIYNLDCTPNEVRAKYPSERQAVKCVGGDTRVPIKNIGLVKIKDICDSRVEDSFTPVSLNTVGINTEITKIKSFYYSGKKSSIKILTKQGRELIASKIHPLLTPTGWKSAGELKIGDKIKRLVGYDCFGDYKYISFNPFYSKRHHDSPYKAAQIKLDENFAWFIGAWQGDGSYCKGKDHFYGALNFCGHPDENLVDEWEKVAINLGLVPSKATIQRQENSTCKYIYIHSSMLVNIFQEMKILDTKKIHRVPPIMFTSPKSVILNYIAGLIDTDGWLTKSRNNFHIGFCTKSKEFAQDIQQLGAMVGLALYIDDSWNKTYKKYYYRLITCAREFQSLQKSLPLRCARKLELLLSKRHTSRKTNYLRYEFDTIREITEQESELFDLEVEDSHLYSGNSLVCHNTIALGIPYGLKKYRLGHILECDPDNAQILIDKYWETYKELHKFVKSCHVEAYKTETSTTETGRIRHLTGLMSIRNIPERQREFHKLLNLSVNHQIQGLAASIINRATIELYDQLQERGYDAHLILQVHDSLVIEARKEQAEDVAKLAKDIMENIYKLKVPLIAEPKIADNLADM